MRYLALFSLLFLTATVCSQSYKSRIHYRVTLGDTTQTHQLILMDYSKLLGLAESIEGDTLYFRLHSASASSAVPVNQMRFLGEFMGKDQKRALTQTTPGFTDMTYERTALPFHSKGQFRTIMLLYNVAEFNLNEHLQIGAGIGGPLGILTTQRLRTTLLPEFHVALSHQSLYIPWAEGADNSVLIVGDVTGIFTFGNDRRFLNVGSGLFYNTDFDDGKVWLHRMGVGGRIGSKWHLYSEAVVSMGEEFSILELYPSLNASYGSRRHRWQFGLMTITISGDNFLSPPIPYVGYAYYWN